MARSIIMDPKHVPQKKNKVVRELPNGRYIPKEMANLADKGFLEVKDNRLHNSLVDVMEKNTTFIVKDDLELFWIGDTVMIYEGNTDNIYITKDSKPEELTPEYWRALLKKK